MYKFSIRFICKAAVCLLSLSSVSAIANEQVILLHNNAVLSIETLYDANQTKSSMSNQKMLNNLLVNSLHFNSLSTIVKHEASIITRNKNNNFFGFTTLLSDKLNYFFYSLKWPSNKNQLNESAKKSTTKNCNIS